MNTVLTVNALMQNDILISFHGKYKETNKLFVMRPYPHKAALCISLRPYICPPGLVAQHGKSLGRSIFGFEISPGNRNSLMLPF